MWTKKYQTYTQRAMVTVFELVKEVWNTVPQTRKHGKLKYFILVKYWKTSAVSTTDGWLKLTLQAAWYVRHAHWARLCYVPCVVFVSCMYDMVVNTQFHKFHGRPFARVLYVFLMKDIGRWLPWVPPGSTGYTDDNTVRQRFAEECRKSIERC